MRVCIDGDVTPLAIGPRNAELVMGQPWRWCRDTARRLGVAVHRTGGKPWIDPRELVAAMRSEGGQAIDVAEDTSDEVVDLDAMRRRIARAG